MINPFIKLTGVNGDSFYIDVNRIQGFCSDDNNIDFKDCSSVIYDRMTKNKSLMVKETVEQITALIQKYHDDCLLASLTSAALSRTDSRVTDAVVMAKRVISRLKESVSEGEENAP